MSVVVYWIKFLIGECSLHHMMPLPRFHTYHSILYVNLSVYCLQIKSQLLDGTQESFTATVSKLSMIEQELEMLKIGM